MLVAWGVGQHRVLLEQERRLFRSCLNADGSPLERLEGLARACAALFPEWAAFGRVIIDLRLEDAKGLRKFFRAIRRDMAAVIAEGQADGSLLPDPPADVSASVLIGAIDGLLLQYVVEPRSFEDLEALASSVAGAVRRVLAA